MPINSPKSTIIKHLRQLRTHKKYRNECQSAIISGWFPINELAPFIPIKTLLFDKEAPPSNWHIQQQHQVEPKILQYTTETTPSEHFVAEIPIPRFDWSQITGRWYLCADGVQNPGNMGTLLRTAHCFNWDAVCLFGDSVDPFNDRCIRSGRGSQFLTPVVQLNPWYLFQHLPIDNTIYVVATCDPGTPILELPPILPDNKNVCLFVGNEARGISKEIMNEIQKREHILVNLPQDGPVQSLNVGAAGSILMHYLKYR